MINLLLGVVIAAGAFGSLLFSLYRVFTVKMANARYAHVALIALILAAMTVISKLWVTLALPVGGALVIAGLGVVALDRKQTWVFPIFASALGLALALKLPF